MLIQVYTAFVPVDYLLRVFIQDFELGRGETRNGS